MDVLSQLFPNTLQMGRQDNLGAGDTCEVPEFPSAHAINSLPKNMHQLWTVHQGALLTLPAIQALLPITSPCLQDGCSGLDILRIKELSGDGSLSPCGLGALRGQGWDCVCL